MIYYDLGPGVEAKSTNIGDAADADVITPAHQAHTTNVVAIVDGNEDSYGVDALITNRQATCIGVRTADCVPVLIYDPTIKAIAAIHSGWKGTAANIISATVNAMRLQYGSNPADMRAAIGPCIHLEAFEVGDEVYDAFAACGYAHYAQQMANPYKDHSLVKWHIDLPAICQSQLQQLGIGYINTSPLCTYREHDSLYSYRYCQCSDRAHRIITSIRMMP